MSRRFPSLPTTAIIYLAEPRQRVRLGYFKNLAAHGYRIKGADGVTVLKVLMGLPY